ncbi:SDR family NAD(P)-dependent oxidoreductase [Streptomyces sp. 184]|uniref:SDR family NAD(P)-dependent oxidoreductase n=1 Tax=Streptomyces sp. 184 TaxID=1827526 RepID=UPI00389221AF
MNATALVVGGNRGIGREVSLLLARAGWDVSAASATGAREVAEVARAAGLRVTPAAADVRDDGSVQRLRGWWNARCTGLDALVVTAGTAITGPMDVIRPADIMAMMDEHVAGAYRMVRAFREPLALRRGHVVFVLSRMGRRPGRYGLAYGTAKAALAHLAGCLAEELADAAIRVNCVSPGSVDTDMLRAALPERAASAMPPDAVADVIAELLGPRFRHVNGAVIDVPGR